MSATLKPDPIPADTSTMQTSRDHCGRNPVKAEDPETVAFMQTLMTPGLALLDVDLLRPAWHARAACRGQGAERFFLARGEHVGPAKAICSGCPVRAECLEAALADPWLAGVWAGTSARERERMRKAAS